MVDPALMNFLEYAKAQEQQMANPQVQMQNGQGMMPSMAPQQAPSNPFDSGIRRAIDSARESLGMNQEQKDIALRRGLFGFANKMSQQPVQKGFWNNFGAIGQAIGQGVNDYDVASEQALVQNNALANQILQYNQAQQAQAMKAEQDAWKRQYMEDEFAWKQQHMADQLAEQTRYHDIIGSRPAGGARGALEPRDVSMLGENISPMEYRTELTQSTNAKSGLGGAKESVDHLLKLYNDYIKKHGDVRITPWGTIANPLLDVKSRFTNDPKAREEKKDWDVLRSALGSFNIGGERLLRGGGSIGIGLLEYMDAKDIYPTLKNNPESALGILNELKRHINKSYKAADLSIKYHARIDPSQVEAVEKNLEALNSLGQSPELAESLPPQATGAPSVDAAPSATSYPSFFMKD